MIGWTPTPAERAEIIYEMARYKLLTFRAETLIPIRLPDSKTWYDTLLGITRQRTVWVNKWHYVIKLRGMIYYPED